MSDIEHSEPDETTREWVTGLLGRTPEAESIVRHIEWLDGESARQAANIRGAVEDRDALAAYVAWRWNPIGDAPITLDDLITLTARLGHPIAGGQ